MCVIVTNYITQLFGFGRHLTDVDDIVKDGMNQILSVINAKFDRMIQSDASSSFLAQAAQITTNTGYMIRACSYLEKQYIKQSTRRVTDTEFLKLARTMFQLTKERCEDMIAKNINKKVDELLSLAASVDWTPSRPVQGVHGFIQGFIFLFKSNCL